MAHPECFVKYSGICVRLISSQGQGLCLYSSLFPGPGTPLSIQWILYIYQKSKRGVKMNPSDLFSSSLILFLVMSHLLLNPSLEGFILIIMFSFLKYLYGLSSSFYVFKYFTVILYSVPNNTRIPSSLGSKSTGD